MKRIAFRVVPAVALLAAGLAWMSPQLSGQSGTDSQARRTVTGRPIPPTSAAASTLRSRRLTPPTSARWKWPGGSRPTTSAHAPKPSSKARRWRFAARSTPPPAPAARSSRSTAELANRSGCTRWTRASARRAGRRVSCRAAVSRTGPTARATSASSTSPPAIAWSRSTRRTASRFRALARRRRRRPQAGHQVRPRRHSRCRSTSRRAKSASTRRRASSATSSSSARRCSKASATSMRPTRRVRSRAFDVRTGKQMWKFEGVAPPGDPGPQDVGERFVRLDRQQRRVDRDHGRSGSRPRLPAGRNADDRRIRRQPPRRQPVCGEPRGGRSEDRRAQVALPVRASPAVGSRHVVGAAADGRDDRRQAAQGRRRALEAGMALLLRPHHRRADLAD